MKIELNEKDSTILKQNKTYTLVDNTKLNNLVVSKTILHPQQNTNGHNHVGKEEVYHFISGENIPKNFPKAGYFQISFHQPVAFLIFPKRHLWFRAS